MNLKKAIRNILRKRSKFYVLKTTNSFSAVMSAYHMRE